MKIYFYQSRLILKLVNYKIHTCVKEILNEIFQTNFSRKINESLRKHFENL